MRRLVMLAAVVLLSGCLMGPDYRRPAVDTPSAYHYQDKDARETANTQWWKDFQDPVLDSLIAEALANNKNVQIAAATIEQAEAVLTQTRSPLFPQVSYGGSALRTRASEKDAVPVSSGVSNPASSFQVFGGVNWELDLWGRVRRLSESARANLLASEEARR
ncbi:MAG TPA: TolC family protein, partial [Geomonas sp.]|nr:TolC family protein [Geomonas sp.]